ncbi:4a-hydroxytetrahydrobiopterin dehydratase [Candidatus Woesearchaeota archaeon]|jgi:4a-hydroxytetrahydrobiopterin dehydratase|nr:4a-hydroxytetrahydrobiopterin dehydratase [Candidatus Woesearchaeota archaeon]
MDLTEKHCLPCKGGMLPLTEEEEDKYKKEIPAWNLIREYPHKLRKAFSFKGFKESMNFVNKVADVAEKECHHPDIYIFYNKVNIELHTHAVKGLSESDFIIAAKIDAL